MESFGLHGKKFFLLRWAEHPPRNTASTAHVRYNSTRPWLSSSYHRIHWQWRILQLRLMLYQSL
jgi:hypothetical protein